MTHTCVPGTIPTTQTSSWSKISSTRNISDQVKIAEAEYIRTWSNSDYTNLVMIEYILRQIYKTENPWEYFFRAVDDEVSGESRWSNATAKIEDTNPQFFTKIASEPTWESDIPSDLWQNGNGLCTSFAIWLEDCSNRPYGLPPSWHDLAFKVR
ncbi:unnamed protein product [Periconia digitata]|uniref:Uncharacterized protein n=1 Tax=Periconia digitata TaxID=1303443 RepID=A0A9W4XI55_9PLEO|nr:unnamed protein product [Periconia digitata]